MGVLVHARLVLHETVEVPDYLLTAAGAYSRRQDGSDSDDLHAYLVSRLLSVNPCSVRYAQWEYVPQPCGQMPPETKPPKEAKP